MPLDEDFGPQIYSSNADLCNVRFPTPIYPLTLSLRFLCRATVLTASRYNRRLGASPAGAAPLRSSSSHSSTGSSRRKARRRRRFGGRTLILRERWKCVEAHAFSLHSILANGWAPIVFFFVAGNTGNAVPRDRHDWTTCSVRTLVRREFYDNCIDSLSFFCLQGVGRVRAQAGVGVSELPGILSEFSDTTVLQKPCLQSKPLTIPVQQSGRPIRMSVDDKLIKENRTNLKFQIIPESRPTPPSPRPAQS